MDNNWESPYQWLQDQSREWDCTQLRNGLLAIVRSLSNGPDIIENVFGHIMEQDGYVKPEGYEAMRELWRNAMEACKSQHEYYAQALHDLADNR
jgi:L-rhamnose isomerase